jgi:hypothetical protein
MTLKKNFPILTNKQRDEQVKHGKIRYRKAKQQVKEAEAEIKEWKKIVR